MIRKFRISIDKFTYQYLEPEWRLPNILLLFKVVLYPFQVMMDEYIAYRDAAIIKANVSCETMSIEWYLNELFDNELRRITIDTATSDGVYIRNEGEAPDNPLYLGNEATEPARFEYLYNPGEHVNFEGKSFAVFIPASLAGVKDQIRGITNIYRNAGKTFTIIET